MIQRTPLPSTKVRSSVTFTKMPSICPRQPILAARVAVRVAQYPAARGYRGARCAKHAGHAPARPTAPRPPPPPAAGPHAPVQPARRCVPSPTFQPVLRDRCKNRWHDVADLPRGLARPGEFHRGIAIAFVSAGERHETAGAAAQAASRAAAAATDRSWHDRHRSSAAASAALRANSTVCSSDSNTGHSLASNERSSGLCPAAGGCACRSLDLELREQVQSASRACGGDVQQARIFVLLPLVEQSRDAGIERILIAASRRKRPPAADRSRLRRAGARASAEAPVACLLTRPSPGTMTVSNSSPLPCGSS